MGGTPTVTFDKSTLTPIASGAPASAAPGPSTGAVTFDKSTLTPIPPTAGPGEQIGYSGLKDIVPKPGESFDDTMQRAVAYGKTLSKADLAKQSAADLKVAPLALAAGPAIAAGQLAVPTAAAAGAGALTAPGAAASETVGTGILDEAGREIMRTTLKYGPSLVEQFGKSAVPWIVSNAVKALPYAGGTAVGGAVTHYLLKHAMNWLP